MFVIIVRKRDLVGYLEQYFDDSDNDNYARLIKNYPSVLEDFLERKCRKNIGYTFYALR